MAECGVSIVKQVAYRDVTQEFANTYHYRFGTSGSTLSQSDAAAIIDRLATLEKGLHSTLVTFVRGICWSSGGTAAQNQLLDEHALTGQGTTTADGTLDKQRAYMIYWDAGLDSRNHPVKLRKWFHSCGVFASSVGTPASTIIANATGFSSTQRSTLAAAADAFNPLVVSGPGNGVLISKNGRIGSTGAHANKYLERHDLGQTWR